MESARSGHFLLESGFHTDRWLDLDELFVHPARLDDTISELAARLRSERCDGLCGPLTGGAFLAQRLALVAGVEFYYTERVVAPAAGTLYAARYELPAAQAARVRGRRLAVVDDVISAGSSILATLDSLEAAGALPVASGCLLLLGTRGEEALRDRAIPLHALRRDALATWPPSDCPLCRAGVALEVPSRI